MKRVIFLVLLLTASVVYANEAHIYEYFINGINTTKDDAMFKDLKILNEKLKYQDAGITSNMIGNAKGQIELLYNEMPSPIEDVAVIQQIIDVLIQKKAEGQQVAIDTVVDAVMHAYGWAFSKNSKEYSDLTEEVKLRLDDLLTSKGKNFDKIATEFAEKSALNALDSNSYDDKYFYIISHSQGNLYANELVTHYDAKIRHFGFGHFFLLEIATPASYVAGYGWGYTDEPIGSRGDYYENYVTSRQDKVIALVPNSLPANETAGSDCAGGDSLGHGLVTTYLACPNLLRKITKKYSEMVKVGILDNVYNDSPYFDDIGHNISLSDGNENHPFIKTNNSDGTWQEAVFLDTDKEYTVEEIFNENGGGVAPLHLAQGDFIKSFISYDYFCDFTIYPPPDDGLFVDSCVLSPVNGSGAVLGISWRTQAHYPDDTSRQPRIGINHWKEYGASNFRCAMLDSGAVKDGQVILANKFMLGREK